MVFSVVYTFSKIVFVFVILEILRHFPSAPDRLHSVFLVSVWSLLHYLSPLKPLSHSCILPCAFCHPAISEYLHRYVSVTSDFSSPNEIPTLWAPFSPRASPSVQSLLHSPLSQLSQLSSFAYIHFSSYFVALIFRYSSFLLIPSLCLFRLHWCVFLALFQKLILYN